MIIKSLILTLILFCLSLASGYNIQDLTWNTQTDDGIAQGFYPIKELQGFITPYVQKGLSAYLLQYQTEKLGQGAYGATYKVQWPGYKNGAIGKINKKEYIARHEASILAYLDGAAGTPKLLAYDTETGAMVMELMGQGNLNTLKNIGLSKKYMLMAFMSLTKSLNELHNQGIVHGDIKPDNVMVSFDHLGRPKMHFIDFGLSTLSGIRGGLVKRKKDWQERLKLRPWYSAEFYKGHILDNRADIPGLAFTMRRLMPDMKTQCQGLYRLTDRAMAHDRDARPFLQEFFQVLLQEYQRLM